MAASISPPFVIPRVFSSLSNPNGGRSGISPPCFFGPTKASLLLARSPPSTIVFARRNKKNNSLTAKRESSYGVKKSLPKDDAGEDDIDEDALEALFSQLEEDLKNDLSYDDDEGDEITEEDLAKLELELEEALGGVDFDEVAGDSPSDSKTLDDDEDSDEEERPPALKNWQIKRLAHALKIGRRKTSIKSLAAELGLDRAFVIELLREPPPYLLLMCASLPDKVAQTTSQVESEPVESPQVLTTDDVENEPEVQEPVHVMQTRWSMQKRLKKVQVETLERVYTRTKRPTNAMICSIVHVTNLPWKRVVKWFEDKREQDGVPQHRVPFRRSVPETIST